MDEDPKWDNRHTRRFMQEMNSKLNIISQIKKEEILKGMTYYRLMFKLNEQAMINLSYYHIEISTQ
jgi:hypothetical protein